VGKLSLKIILSNTFLLQAFNDEPRKPERKVQEIKTAFSEYTTQNTLLVFDTPGYFARRFLPDVFFFLKVNVIQDLIEAGVMAVICERWIIKK
jgi:hypothetical protein